MTTELKGKCTNNLCHELQCFVRLFIHCDVCPAQIVLRYNYVTWLPPFALINYMSHLRDGHTLVLFRDYIALKTGLCFLYNSTGYRHRHFVHLGDTSHILDTGKLIWVCCVMTATRVIWDSNMFKNFCIFPHACVCVFKGILVFSSTHVNWKY